MRDFWLLVLLTLILCCRRSLQDSKAEMPAEANCLPTTEVANPERLRVTKLVFAAFKKEYSTKFDKYLWSLAIINEYGAFTTPVLPSLAEPFQSIHNEDTFSARFFVVNPNVLDLFYYGDDGKARCSRYTLECTPSDENKTVCTFKEPNDLPIYNFGNALRGSQHLRYLGQAKMDSIVNYASCRDVENPVDVPMAQCADASIIITDVGITKDVQLCTRREYYCLTDVGLGTVHAYKFPALQKFHYKQFGNTFTDVDVTGLGEEADHYTKFDRQIFIYYNNTNDKFKKKFVCVNEPMNYELGVIYDLKWDWSSREYQPILFEAPKYVEPTCSIFATTPWFAGSIITALAMTFIALCSFTFERAGHRRRLKHAIMQRRLTPTENFTTTAGTEMTQTEFNL